MLLEKMFLNQGTILILDKCTKTYLVPVNCVRMYTPEIVYFIFYS